MQPEESVYFYASSTNPPAESFLGEQIKQNTVKTAKMKMSRFLSHHR